MIELRVQKQLKAATGTMHLDVDLQLPGGRLIGLYGKSGAGKTSLLRILAGLFSPDEALIKINEEVWADSTRGIALSPQERKLGMVFQDYALFPNMTVREHLQFALRKGQPAEIVRELIATMELDELQHEYPRTLSGGQRQRVALARALVQQPQLLLLDEPLSALDTDLRAKLQQLLLRVQRTYNCTTILISHDPTELRALADWVLVLEAGKIVQQGRPEHIFADQPTYPITLKGILRKVEDGVNGYWLTIEQDGQRWRVHAARRHSYVVGEEVAVTLDVMPSGVMKK